MFDHMQSSGHPHRITMIKAGRGPCRFACFAPHVKNSLSSQSKIVFKELPSDDPKVRRPNIDKARELLGWEPKVKRIDGLRTTIDYFKQKVADGVPQVSN